MPIWATKEFICERNFIFFNILPICARMPIEVIQEFIQSICFERYDTTLMHIGFNILVASSQRSRDTIGFEFNRIWIIIDSCQTLMDRTTKCIYLDFNNNNRLFYNYCSNKLSILMKVKVSNCLRIGAKKHNQCIANCKISSNPLLVYILDKIIIKKGQKIYTKDQLRFYRTTSNIIVWKTRVEITKSAAAS